MGQVSIELITFLSFNFKKRHINIIKLLLECTSQYNSLSPVRFMWTFLRESSPLSSAIIIIRLVNRIRKIDTIPVFGNHILVVEINTLTQD